MAADAASKEPGAGSRETEEEVPPSAIPADAPSGPSSEEEAAFLAQEREMGIVTPALMHTESPPEENGDLPQMEDLIKRIPAPAREALEDLFRPQFVTVSRIPQSALKS